MKYIYHHLGLGDHIICNGLTRQLIKRDPDEQYTMFVKEHNFQTVSYMYRDLKNLSFHTVITDDDVSKFLSEKHLLVHKAGFGWHPNANPKEFDKVFYLQHDIDFKERWDSFYCERDLSKEIELFKKFNIIENEYIFVHDDVSRGYEIDEQHIENKHLPIIRPILGLTDNIIDYLYLMNHSREAHFIDSSFKTLFDSFRYKISGIYHHLRLKNGTMRSSMISGSKLNFTVIL